MTTAGATRVSWREWLVWAVALASYVTAVLAWPGPAPGELLGLLAVVLGLGGPASLVAFDLARACVSGDQVGRATGVTNVGGWLATLVVVLGVGLLLDLQGAGRPEDWTPEALRVAMLAHYPLWVLGVAGMLRLRGAAGHPVAA